MGCGAAVQAYRSSLAYGPSYASSSSSRSSESSYSSEADAGAEGTWCFEESPGNWIPFQPALQAKLKTAQSLGEPKFVFTLPGSAAVYEADLEAKTQTNWDSGHQRKLTFRPNEGQGSAGASSPAESSKTSSRVSPPLIKRNKDATGEWQWEGKVGNGSWQPFDPEVSSLLTAARKQDRGTIIFEAAGKVYKANLDAKFQVNVQTGFKRPIRWVPRIQFQWEMKNGLWMDYEEEENDTLVEAKLKGLTSVRYEARGFEYSVDFRSMRQDRLSSNAVAARKIRILGSDLDAEPMVGSNSVPTIVRAPSKQAGGDEGPQNMASKLSAPSTANRAGSSSSTSYGGSSSSTAPPPPRMSTGGAGLGGRSPATASRARSQSTDSGPSSSPGSGTPSPGQQIPSPGPNVFTEPKEAKPHRSRFGFSNLRGAFGSPPRASSHERAQAGSTSTSSSTKPPSSGPIPTRATSRPSPDTGGAGPTRASTSASASSSAGSKSQSQSQSHTHAHSQSQSQSQSHSRSSGRSDSQTKSGSKSATDREPPGFQRQSRPGPGPEPPPKTKSKASSSKSSAGAGASAGPGGGTKSKASQSPPKPPPSSSSALPTGVSLPTNPKSRKAAEALVAEFKALGAGSLESDRQDRADERRKAYKLACLRWHPDKNLQDEDTATEVFQFLQLLKEWALSS